MFKEIQDEQRFNFYFFYFSPPKKVAMLSNRVLAYFAEQRGKCLDIAPLCFFSTNFSLFFFKLNVYQDTEGQLPECGLNC